MDAETRFRILAKVALADGVLDDGEREVLLRCSSWLGIPRQRAGALLQEVRAGQGAAVTPPSDPAERERIFTGVLNVVLADGRVTPQEGECLRTLAQSFGIAPGRARGLLQEASRRWQRLRVSQSESGRLHVAGPPSQAPAPSAGIGPSPAGPAALAPSLGASFAGEECMVIPLTPPPEPDLGEGALIGGKFRIVRPLGEGGFGAVFRARHEDLDEDVALKLLLPSLVARNPAAEQRFLQEVRLTRAFAHRYAVALREFGRDPRHGLFFTMDLVAGETLGDLLAREGVQPPARVVRLAAQALEALEEAHRVGIVHRDLKPANLMVTTGPTGEEEVRVLDFGVAKAVSSARSEGPSSHKLTKVGALVGTPTYMSPEQAQSEELDRRSDIYALGVVLYEALCGCLPYAIDPDTVDVHQAIFFQILAEPPRDPLAVNPALPRSLGPVLLRALAKERDGRYPDARAFREALLAALAAEPDRATNRLAGWVKSRLLGEGGAGS